MQRKLEMQVKESMEGAAVAWGPANNWVKNTCKTTVELTAINLTLRSHAKQIAQATEK